MRCQETLFLMQVLMEGCAVAVLNIDSIDKVKSITSQ